MIADSQGIDFLKSLEGCRLEAYQDGAGVWTIGYGHTRGVNSSTRPITMDEAEELLKEDLRGFERCLTEALSVTPTQSQFNALLAFVFNVGVAAFLNSTLLKKLNSGDVRGAAKELDRWNKIRDPKTKNMVVSVGLANRRAKEKALLLADVESSRTSVS